MNSEWQNPLKLTTPVKDGESNTEVRVTKEYVESLIVDTSYRKFESKNVLCVLKLKNGFQVEGWSGVVWTPNFNMEIGMKVAYDNALSKVFLLEGYLLQQRLYESGFKSI